MAVFAALLSPGAPALAQTGVSDDRVSLPEGPGSLEGVGESVKPNLNMGTMSYSVPVPVPAGFAGTTPDMALRYDSGAGSGPVGIGWSMDVPNIERLTLRGLPEYDTDDEFTASGGQLVRVSADPLVYRARRAGVRPVHLARRRGRGRRLLDGRVSRRPRRLLRCRP
jgi:hypothetical protein